jgi:hypothetical protein
MADAACIAPSGKCVNLTYIAGAPAARVSKARGGRARESGLWNPGIGIR